RFQGRPERLEESRSTNLRRQAKKWKIKLSKVRSRIIAPSLLPQCAAYLSSAAETGQRLDSSSGACACNSVTQPARLLSFIVRHKGSMNRLSVLVAILALVEGFASTQPGSSNRACVTGALEKDRHAFQYRFDPPLLCSSHK